MDGKSTTTVIIFLIGYMASGKTTIGRALADQLDVPFYDIDALIVAKEGRTIQQIFDREGETYFRRLEAEAVRGLIDIDEGVVATGGGLPCYNDQMSYLLQLGTVVYLRSSISDIVHRLAATDHRPLHAATESSVLRRNVRKHLSDRRHIYELASIRVDNRGDLAATVQRIIRKVKGLEK